MEAQPEEFLCQLYRRENGFDTSIATQKSNCFSFWFRLRCVLFHGDVRENLHRKRNRDRGKKVKITVPFISASVELVLVSIHFTILFALPLLTFWVKIRLKCLAFKELHYRSLNLRFETKVSCLKSRRC